jgi:hypothetical protein
MDKNRICHDLKTERPDVGRPLPGALRLVPVSLYFCTVAFVLGVGWMMWQMHNARTNRAHWQSVEAGEKAKQNQLTKELDAVNVKHKQAEEIKKWVQGSDMLQELIVEIVQSMAVDSHISDLSIARAKDNPRQLSLTLRISAKEPNKQIDTTKGRLSANLEYKVFGDKFKTEKGGLMDWTAYLQREDNWKPKTVNTAAVPQ